MNAGATASTRSSLTNTEVPSALTPVTTRLMDIDNDSSVDLTFSARPTAGRGPLEQSLRSELRREPVATRRVNSHLRRGGGLAGHRSSPGGAVRPPSRRPIVARQGPARRWPDPPGHAGESRAGRPDQRPR